MNPAAAIIVAYFLGAVPSSAIAGRIAGVDLRSEGSGNLGFTNVLRVLGPRAAVPVLIADAGKGVAAVVLARHAVGADWPLGAETTALLGGLAAIAGHVWSVFVRFRGGKGVATAAAVFGALAPPAAGISIAAWLIVVLSTRYVSLASITGAVLLPLAVAATHAAAGVPQPVPLLAASTGIAVLVVATHRANIRRLLNGTENRFGSKRRTQGGD
ncbi:MAG: glycerol-3-phosphate 1-O-acyltransferase PlsY [Candidatus Eisenbacteria bacterium]|nr:glycerol-3-phosphate 1-O-acyltransferase PlsY [Candidatus Eisenbacteria bacterium]